MMERAYDNVVTFKKFISSWPKTQTYFLTFGFSELGFLDTINADVLKTLSEGELEAQIHKYLMNLHIGNFHV